MVMASKLVEELKDAIATYGDAPVTIELGDMGVCKEGWDTRDIHSGSRIYNSFIVGYIGRKLHFSLHPEYECSLYENRDIK